MFKFSTINKKSLFSIIYIVIYSLFFICIKSTLNMFDGTIIWIAFLGNLSFLVLIIINNGFDILFLFLFCLNYLLFPIMFQYFGGSSYGLLEKASYSLYMPELITYIFIYNAVFTFLSIITNFSNHERSLVQVKVVEVNDITIHFNEFIAIIFTIIAFPRLSINAAPGERFDMLLPGHAWNQLAIVALLFNLPYLKKRLDVKLVYLFVILWFLLNGERADITGLILGLVFYFLMFNGMNNSQRMLKKSFFALILLFFLAIILNLIVELRIGTSSINITSLLKGILVTPTTADVGYLYNVSIDYLKKYGELHGEILKANILSMIPFAEPYGFNNIIESANYADPGGEPLLAEPIMDFGAYGLGLIATVDFLFFRFLVQFKNTFSKYEYITILCLIPRIVWYGRSFAYSSFLFFVPVMFLINYGLSKYIKKSN